MTLWLALLFVYSPMSEVALKLLDCRKFGDRTLSYYAPTYECFSDYHGYQYLVFILVGIVIVFPGLTVFVCWKQKRRGRGRLIDPFVPRFWWWAAVILTRRFVLVLFSVLPISILNRQALLSCGCMLVAANHIYCSPYVQNVINHCEAVFLCTLALISTLSLWDTEV